MTPFPLKIVTPDGVCYDGMAQMLTVRTIGGDLGIMAGHADLVAPLGMGRATVVIDGQKRYAACMGGILSVTGDRVDLVPTTFEWADQIDAQRADASYQKAQQILSAKDASDTDLALAEARLKRALVRKNVASMK